MSKRMTLEEIERDYPNEWVVVGDYTADDSVIVRDGVVVAHSSSADDAHRFARDYRGDLAIWFVGKPFPEGFIGCAGVFQ
jgi:hypothetical protein